MGNTVKEYSQMIGFLTRDKTSTVPRSMDPEPRNMYAQGQLVRNTVDGSRPGYGGLTDAQKKNQNAWIEANPDKIFEELSSGQKYEIRKGNINVGVGDFRPSGVGNAIYKPLSKEGEKIAKHVYGTLDIPDRTRQNINAGMVTMDTKPVKMNKETDISVKSKKGQPVTDVDFKGMKMPDGTDMKTAFMEDLKLRATEPQKSTISNKYGNKYFADKYPISDRQLKRAIPFLFKREGLEYAQPDETTLKRLAEKRKKVLEPIDSSLQKGRIVTAKSLILKEQNLASAVDTAHRVSKKHMNRLGLQFDTNTIGMDARIINQVIIRPSEIKLDKLYKEQFEIFEKLKKKPTDALRTDLSKINKKVDDIIKTTSGRLIGVNIDPNTLESSFTGIKKKYSLTKFMDENISMKNLAKFGPRSDEQIEFLTKQLPKAINAEITRGFVPNDFKKILSDKKSQEAILKYTKLRAPELMGQIKKAIKFPNSKIAMKVMSVPIIAGAAYEWGEDILKGTGIVDRKYEQTASTSDAPVVEKGFSTGQKLAGAGVTAGAAYKFGKPILKGLGKIAGVGFGPTGIVGLNAALGVNPKNTADRIGLEAEAILAPSIIKGATDVTSKIKNPMFRKIAERASLGLMSPAMAMRAARIASPIGIASLGLEGLYHLGKKGVAEKRKLNAMTDQEREDYMRSEIDPLMDEGGML